VRTSREVDELLRFEEYEHKRKLRKRREECERLLREPLDTERETSFVKPLYELNQTVLRSLLAGCDRGPCGLRLRRKKRG
jgi:hypothetical protein